MMRCEVYTSFDALGPRIAQYETLHAELRGSLFLHPAWQKLFAQHFLGEQPLYIVCALRGEELLAVWALYLELRSMSSIRRRELRGIGFAGISAESLLCHPAAQVEVAPCIAECLAKEAGWDSIVATTNLAEFAASLNAAFATRAITSEYAEVPARPAVTLTKHSAPAAAAPDGYHLSSDVTAALARMQSLKRKQLETTEPGAGSDYDTRTVRFLEALIPEASAHGQARIGQLGGRLSSACDVVLYDGARHVQVLCAADPAEPGALEQICLQSMEYSAKMGAAHFVFADERGVSAAAPEPQGRLRVWNHTPVGRIERGLRGVKEAVRSIDRWQRSKPLNAALKAVQRVAHYRTFHLYRGELYTHGFRVPSQGRVELWSAADFTAKLGAADSIERGRFCQRMELNETQTERRLARGDLLVVALGEEAPHRPLGVAFVAVNAHYVADIGRRVQPASVECYVYDVFVHPDERGQKIAPALLDAIASQLRARDFYRGWALIERSNAASIRAFEKAGYTPVADVVVVQTGLGAHMFVRPPDPEARAFLGL